jgi:TPR repeat protein
MRIIGWAWQSAVCCFLFFVTLLSAQDGLPQGLLFPAGNIAVTAASAEQGNAEAQHVLGLSYLYGQGMPQDEQRAFEWIKKAAEQGYSPAEVDLGHLYVQGRGIQADRTEGLKWYLAAARQIKYANHNQVEPRPILLSAIGGHTVEWQAGHSVPGTGLALFTEVDHKLVAVTAADDQGSFSFPNVKPGSYRGVAVYYPLCPANVPVKVTSGRRAGKELVVHMRPEGLDACSWGDSR